MEHVVSSTVSKAIDKLEIFKSLDEQTKESLKEAGRFHAFAPGQVLVREGDVSGDLFLIDSGTVEIKMQSKGEQVALAELGPGDILGEVPAITGVRRTSTATAMEMVNVVILPADLIKEIADKDPEFKNTVLRIIENRAVDTMSKTIP
ncbi:MAG: cyclic nucleotide-binding domain-containing protein [Proteobacteria bacterium]|nr:cyclic nucleotide-binding domain-containing protein [Pseudomonadota bacterium]